MTVTFPDLSSRDLNRRDVRLPQDFTSAVTLLAIAWVRQDQRAVDTWLPTFAAIEAEHDDVDHVELPVVGDMGRVRRTMLDNVMRGGITDPSTRARTITLYVDTAAFRSALEIEDPDQIVVMALDANHVVRWRHAGACTPEAATSLREAVAEMLI